jgi:hypothetical protein
MPAYNTCFSSLFLHRVPKNQIHVSHQDSQNLVTENLRKNRQLYLSLAPYRQDLFHRLLA